MNRPLLRAKVAHFTDQGYQPGGVVHVGANTGEEIPWYLYMGHIPIIAFEPLTEPFETLYRDFKGVGRSPEFPDGVVWPIQAALGKHDNSLTLRIPENGDTKGASAFYPIPQPPPMEWTGLKMAREEKVNQFRFDTLAPDLPWLKWIDLLVIDVQGMEYEVLEGFGECLSGFNFLNIECSETPIYAGERPAADIVGFLAQKGFLQDSPIVSHDDVFFVRAGIQK